MCQFLTRLKGLSSILVLGCSHSAEAVHPSVAKLFTRTISIPLPVASERRRVARIIFEPTDLLHSSENCRKIDLFADSLSAMPLGPLVVKIESFLDRLLKDQTTGANEVRMASDGLTTSEVYGHEKEKKMLIEAITWPRRFVAMYKLYNIKPLVGILLFGPPGTGMKRVFLISLRHKSLFHSSVIYLQVKHFLQRLVRPVLVARS